MKPLNLVLVPGFFGFGRLGEISYFSGVASVLAERLAPLGYALRVTEVVTPPTASIRTRAARVLEALELAMGEPGDIHVIGHSTGGLDARLAVAETASLPTAARLCDRERLRSLISISCPHYGTNVSTFFTRPLGRALFRAGARYLAFVLERRRLPLGLLLRISYGVVRLWDPRQRHRGTFDEVYEGLLRDLSDARRRELAQFLRQIAREQALLFQLTPAGCDLLNACTLDPPLAYASVVTCAARPRLRTLLTSVADLYALLVFPLFWLLHRLSREAGDALREKLTGPQLKVVDDGLGRPATGGDSDGVVPVLSQVWGTVLHFARADHLDVVGHYGPTNAESTSGDWLPSKSGFDRAAFEALWADVAEFIARASNGVSAPEAHGSDAAGEAVTPSARSAS
jgi:triacylglycerol lipase